MNDKIMIQSMTDIIKEYLSGKCDKMLSSPKGNFRYKCLLPAAEYSKQLWDWGCFTSNIAIRQIFTEGGREKELDEYEKGCRLNFLDFSEEDGRIPIVIATCEEADLLYLSPNGNIHKPVMAQHIAFISKYTGDTEWIRDHYGKVEAFLNYYETHYKHESGLYFFADDFAIGVDNDPSTFFRPCNSSASIYLNCLMYKEFCAMEYISSELGLEEKVCLYATRAESIKKAVKEHCWDEKDGFYYSCDINLMPIESDRKLHAGCPRHYNTLIQRIGSWSGFLAMWAGIADKEQAERMVKENLLDKNGFWSPYGVRSLSKYEKMYRSVPSMNPSCWHGPIWGIANYMVFKGLVDYGFTEVAEELVDKTILLFGKDIKENGTMHEYYDAETGKGVINPGFLSWNMLIANMIAWKEGRTVISEI